MATATIRVNGQEVKEDGRTIWDALHKAADKVAPPAKKAA